MELNIRAYLETGYALVAVARVESLLRKTSTVAAATATATTGNNFEKCILM